MSVRVPITNTLTQSDFTARISVGGQPVDILLDTGSAVLAVDGRAYDPDADPACKTSKIAQIVQYGSGGWVGAVVQTALGFSPDLVLGSANVAVTYATQSAVFGQAKGILGLAYQALDSGFLMPADSWAAKYDADQIAAGQQADVTPCFDQLEKAGLASARFAFLIKRSVMRGVMADPTADPLNAGVFILGGGADCTDLYSGGFAYLAVLHDKFYNINLLSVQVGGQPPIAVPPAAPGSTATSNAIVDSGTSSLLLDQGLYTKILAAFGAINAGFAESLTRYGIDAGNFIDQTQIDLTAWPALNFVFSGADGNTATVVVGPADYWQFDAVQAGLAVAMLAGDGGKLGGQSIFGLPAFSAHFVVFDRSASNGHGVIGFAAQA